MAPSSATDWIQAICSVLGLIGLAVTVWKLLARDNNREKEIDQLFRQVDNSTKLNELQKENNAIMQDFMIKLSNILIEIEKGKLDDNTLLKFNESQYNIRKNDLKPFLLLNGTSRSSQGVTVYLINKGNIAYNITIKMIDSSNMFLRNTIYNALKILEHDNKLEVSFTFSKIEDSFIEIEIEYNDKDQNKYIQKLKYNNVNMKSELTDPSEINKN